MTAPRVVTQMLAEADLSADDDLAAFLTALHALGDGPAPAPAPELAERLGVSPLVKPRRWLRRRVVGGATALALAVVGGTGVAAAANELPAEVQRLMARFSAQFLPFDFPPPVESGPVPVHVGRRPGDRAGHEAGLHGEPSGTDRAAMAAGRSHHPAVAPGGVPAPGDGAGSGGAGTRSAADDGVGSDVADGSGSDGGSGGDGSRDAEDSPERTGGETQQASEPGSSGSDGTGETSDGSGSTDGGSDGSGSGYVAGGSDPDGDPDGSSDSGESGSGGG